MGLLYLYLYLLWIKDCKHYEISISNYGTLYTNTDYEKYKHNKEFLINYELQNSVLETSTLKYVVGFSLNSLT